MNRTERSRTGSAIDRRKFLAASGLALAGGLAGSLVTARAAAAPGRSIVAAGSQSVDITIGVPLPAVILPTQFQKAFEQAHPNINVSWVTTNWGDFPTKLQALITAGQTPTVFLYDGGTVQGYGAKGLALNLKPFIQKSKLNASKFIDLTYSQDPKGRVWGIPQGYQPVAVAYNKALFDQAGVPYPSEQWTWSDMIDTAVKLHQKTGKFGLITDHDITAGWLPFIWANGGVPFNKNVTKADFTSPLVEKGVQQWVSLVQQGVICNQATVQANNNNLVTVFGRGLGAMEIMQYGAVGGVLTSFPSLNWDVVPLPRGAINTIPNIANPWVVYKNASPAQQQAAWTFLEWWLSPQVQAEYTKLGLAVPVLKSAGSDLPTTPAHLVDAYVNAPAKYGRTMYETSKWGDWETVAEPIFQQIFEGQISVKAGLQKVNTAVNGVLNGSSQE